MKANATHVSFAPRNGLRSIRHHLRLFKMADLREECWFPDQTAELFRLSCSKQSVRLALITPKSTGSLCLSDLVTYPIASMGLEYTFTIMYIHLPVSCSR